jgi:hypothetical protein
MSVYSGTSFTRMLVRSECGHVLLDYRQHVGMNLLAWLGHFMLAGFGFFLDA